MDDDLDLWRPAPVGVGAYGRENERLVEQVRRFLRSAGRADNVIFAMNTGRVMAKQHSLSRWNFGPRFVITPKTWLVLDRSCSDLLLEGDLGEIVWARETIDGLKLLLSGDRALRFVPGAIAATRLMKATLAAVAQATVEDAFPVASVPAQRPVLLDGAHYGGYGSPLVPDAPALLAMSGRGLCVLTPSSAWRRDTGDLLDVQIGGVGEYTAGGGWIGGGLGVSGALEGAASAGLLNWLTTRRRMDTVLRLVFPDAEATFALETHAPGRLEIELAALLAHMRGGRAPSGSVLAVHSLAGRRSDPVSGGTGEQPARFCPSCGTSRSSGADFCISCGTRLP